MQLRIYVMCLGTASLRRHLGNAKPLLVGNSLSTPLIGSFPNLIGGSSVFGIDYTENYPPKPETAS